MYPLLSVLVLVLDIAAIADILQRGASAGWKVLWVLLVLFLPLLGMISISRLGNAPAPRERIRAQEPPRAIRHHHQSPGRKPGIKNRCIPVVHSQGKPQLVLKSSPGKTESRARIRNQRNKRTAHGH
jgi:hypothetical protein